MPVTMKDIARELGVSVVTISKVLHGHTDIGETTRKRVLKCLEERNYRPNLAARGLITGRSYLVGLVVPDLLHPFFAEIAKSLSSALRSEGYSVILASSEENPELERRELELLQSRGLDALIIASTDTSSEHLKPIASSMPCILIDRKLPGLSSAFAGVDDRMAGFLATEHLIKTGCKRIAHIHGRENSTSVLRYEGYLQALKKYGIRASKEYVIYPEAMEDRSRESGQQAMKKLLALRNRPDGIFCYNDPMAIGALAVILEAGLSIPNDIALVGCGNLNYDDVLQVPLTSVDQQSDGLGRAAAKLILDTLANRKIAKKELLLKPKLVIRSSTKKNGRASAKAR